MIERSLSCHQEVKILPVSSSLNLYAKENSNTGTETERGKSSEPDNVATFDSHIIKLLFLLTTNNSLSRTEAEEGSK